MYWYQLKHIIHLKIKLEKKFEYHKKLINVVIYKCNFDFSKLSKFCLIVKLVNHRWLNTFKSQIKLKDV